ncbi:LysR family transcriptional regulator [Oxalobacteraceae bacterium OM1]|nr:LysR family transcriptional regulator [Oxalobacteraceae bacterium OM1]
MDIVAAMKVFTAVVDAGSFAAAADRLGMSRAMASKSVANLEDHLGTRLLNRTTRRLSLTESGLAFYERSVQILADVEEAQQAAGNMAAEPRGTLRVTMPLSYGLHRMGPVVAAYTDRYPRVKLGLSLSDRKVDLVEEGYDVAVRIGKLPESGLVARKLGTMHSVVVAAPAYLKRHGRPEVPADLARHACLGYSLASMGDEWRLQGPDGIVSVRSSGAIKADNGDLLRLAAIAGSGLIFQPWFIVEEDVRAGRLERVLDGYVSEELGIYAVYPSRRHLSAKVRTFVDVLLEQLAQA